MSIKSLKKSDKNMILLKNFLPALCVIIHSFALGQIKANFSAKTNDLLSVDITIDDVTIQLNSDGQISGFQSNNSNGDVDYYDDANFDSYRFGKLKNMGVLKVNYWDILDKSDLRSGKIKNVGNVSIDYYDNFDKEKYGKVKNIGNLKVDYWENDIMDNSSLGKLKSIGNISIDYGQKDITDSSKYKKLIRFGAVCLEYWNDRIFNKEKFGKLRSVKGNSKDVSVNLVW